MKRLTTTLVMIFGLASGTQSALAEGQADKRNELSTISWSKEIHDAGSHYQESVSQGKQTGKELKPKYTSNQSLKHYAHLSAHEKKRLVFGSNN